MSTCETSTGPVEVRAFGVVARPGVEVPKIARRRKPAAEMTIDEMRAELDRLEKEWGEDGNG